MALGWTIDRLAREAGRSASVVQLVEKGAGENRSLASKRRISAALGWAPESLEELGRSGREPVRVVTELNATGRVIAELAAKLPHYQQRFVEEHLRYLVELNRRVPSPNGD
jgi:hypothetical protein